MIEKYNIYYTCDISSLSDQQLKIISNNFWTVDRKIVEKQNAKIGNHIFIVVTSIFDDFKQINPIAKIFIGKQLPKL